MIIVVKGYPVELRNDVSAVALTDLTEHHTMEGKLHMCAVKYACSERIVGYSIDSRMKVALVVKALRAQSTAAIPS